MEKPGKQILWGVILFVLGAMVIPVVFVVAAFVHAAGCKPLAKFVIPAQVTVTVEQPGRYYLWNNYQTVFEGKSYSDSPSFPDGLEISLIENQTGTAVAFLTNASISVTSNNDQKNSIGYVEIEQSGDYTLSVTGSTPPRVCSLGKTIFSLRNVLAFLACFGFTMAIGLAGFVLVIVGLVNVSRSRKNPVTQSVLEASVK